MASSRLVEELAQLTALDAPSGFEEPVLAFCRQALHRVCDSVHLDQRGNLLAHLPGTSTVAPTIAVMTHADEIGLQVTRVDRDGFLGFTRIGGITEAALPGSRFHLLTRQGRVEGVVGIRPGHLASSGEQGRALPALVDMYLDVGATGADEVHALGIEPGTPAVFASPLASMANPRRVFGKAIDNRAGILAQLQLAEYLRHHPPPGSVWFIVTVEEEVGLRGAAVATVDLPLDVIIAVDTVPAGGTPDVPEKIMPWRIGAGPLIKVRETKGLVTHRPLREHFRRVADEHKIPVQVIVDTAGITDATAAQQANSSIAALTVGLARRYSHSAVEMLDLDDLENLIRLLHFAVSTLDSRDLLRRLK